MPMDDIKVILRDVNFARYRGYSLLNLLVHGGLFQRQALRTMDGPPVGRRPLRDLGRICTWSPPMCAPASCGVQPRQQSRPAGGARGALFDLHPLIFPFHHHGDHVLVDGSILPKTACSATGPATSPRWLLPPARQAHRRRAPGAQDLPVADYLFMWCAPS